MTTQTGTRPYKDLDVSFLANPGTGDLRTKTGSDAIKQSVRTLCLTDFSVRPYEDTFGSSIWKSLFENYNEFTKSVTESRIKEILTRYEPRIVVGSVVSDFSFDDTNTLTIKITYAEVNGPISSVNISLTKVR